MDETLIFFHSLVEVTLVIFSVTQSVLTVNVGNVWIGGTNFSLRLRMKMRSMKGYALSQFIRRFTGHCTRKVSSILSSPKRRSR